MELTIAELQSARSMARPPAPAAQAAASHRSSAPGAKIVLDMSGVGYMSSAGLRMLLSLYRQVGRQRAAGWCWSGFRKKSRTPCRMTGFLDFSPLPDTDRDRRCWRSANVRADSAMERIDIYPTHEYNGYQAAARAGLTHLAPRSSRAGSISRSFPRSANYCVAGALQQRSAALVEIPFRACSPSRFRRAGLGDSGSGTSSR